MLHATEKGFYEPTPTTPCPYECLQKDVLDYQSRGAQIFICGDLNARTAEEPDLVRTIEVQPFLPIAPDDEELPDYIPHRRDCNKVAAGSQTWGPELLGLCQPNNFLILNGRTLGDECGQCTFQSARGKSTIDYFIASIQCVTAAKSLHVLEEAARYASDHNPLTLHIACDIHKHAPTSNPSVVSDARVRYDIQRAEAYQEALASLLQQRFIPFIQHELDVDLLATKLGACLISAARSTMPQACKRSGVCSRKQQAWFDSRCKEALAQKEAVYNNPQSTATQKLIAEKTFRSLTDRVKETWLYHRNMELCEMAAKDATKFWKLFKTPVELSAQFALVFMANIARCPAHLCQLWFAAIGLKQGLLRMR